MAPKKKKKSGKMAKMTEAEREVYLEQQRLAEEEMRKKKEDMLTQFLKDKLTKEEKASKFNLNKLNHQWRNIMREAKSKELKKDIEILSQTFERVVDRKDSVIKSLAKDLMEADEQHAMAIRSHLQNVDKLIDLHQERVGTLENEFDAEKAMLQNEFDSEQQVLLEQHSLEMSDLQDIMFAMEQNYNDQELLSRSEFQSTRDEIKNKNLEEKHALRVNLEQTVEGLWTQFQVALRNYQETTEERKKAFEELKAKDEKSAREIETQMRKLQRLSDNISQLKAKMVSNSKESDERNKSLREEREMMLTHFQALKGQMNSLRSKERERLTKLTLESNNAIKKMKERLEQGEKVLRLAEMCRKQETEEEKVLPFFASSLTAEEQEDVLDAIQEEPKEDLSKVMYQYGNMENFWKRFNKVALEKTALDKERSVLSSENHQLRTLLKQYLDGISVNDDILNQVNPLFVVNHKTNVKMNVPLMDPRIKRPAAQTVLEASHIAKNLPA